MEHFYGHDLEVKTLDMRCLRIDPHHREGEATLMQSRWFDYIGMHPGAATYLYAHCYKEQLKRFYEQVVDVRTVERARAFTPDDIFYSRDLTSMWLARRFADEMRLPYPFVLQFAQERFLSRTQHTFPRPNQLYGEELEQDIKDAWETRLAAKLTYAESERYRMRNYKGEVAQARHVKFLIDQVKRRPAPHHRLIARLLNEDLINQPMALVHFGQVETERAEAYRAEYLISHR